MGPFGGTAVNKMFGVLCSGRWVPVEWGKRASINKEVSQVT